MDIADLYKIYLQHSTVATDTRHLPSGCLYFALKGKNFNGNLFAREALDKGAAFAIIDEGSETIDERFILVEDVLSTMQKLARHHRDQLNIPVLGITGSNGKTTTKELLAAVLTKKFRCHVTKGNLNNHIGVPLTLLAMSTDTEIAVIEMGANKVGDNAELCHIFNPNYGLITNIGKEHLEGFGDLEGVARGNSELYVHLLKNAGSAFVNAADEHLMRMAARIPSKILYSIHTTADYEAKIQQSNPEILLTIQGKPYHSFLFGEYNAENVTAAVAIGLHFGVAVADIQMGIEEYIPTNNRSQVVRTKENILYIDCYNANPSSMALAIQNFVSSDHALAEKVLMLGDMFEMGDHEFEEHQSLMTSLGGLQSIRLFICGQAFGKHKHLANCQWFENSTALKNYIEMHPLTNAAILIKGSRGMKMEEVVSVL